MFTNKNIESICKIKLDKNTNPSFMELQLDMQAYKNAMSKQQS